MTPKAEDGLGSDPRAVVMRHLDAFNEHSTDRLLAGFADDAVWATGQDVFRGKAALAELFDESPWELAPSLTVQTLVCADDVVVAELCEDLTVEGEHRLFMIAVFLVIHDGLIQRQGLPRGQCRHRLTLPSSSGISFSHRPQPAGHPSARRTNRQLPRRNRIQR